MKRQMLDKLLIAAGIVMMTTLIVGGSLAAWGEAFAAGQIQSQLTQEKIYFPKAGTPALDANAFPGLQQYGGTQVDSGVKAKAYADEFIWVHMMKASGNETYAQVGALASANPQDPKLAALKTTLFQGDMLRSSLLTAYAFSRFGLIAHWAALTMFTGAAIMFGLILLGFVHMASYRRAR